jgi:tripartite-type tricarboxylate transporter receptor subunit TctC
MTKNILTTAFVLAGALLAVPASAQDFPTRTITMNMPYSAGGPGDTIARLLAQGMSGPLKQQVIVENTTGAGGSIGSAKVAASPPDGYNLLLIHISHATNPALYPKLKYDPIKDYEPIGLAVDLPSVFVARKDLPAANLAELIAWMKTNKEKVNYAHAGIGSASHLCGLLLNTATGTQPTQIAYRGAGPAMNDMMSGQVDVMCDQIVNVVGNVDGGTIKGYAVTSTEKAPALPKLPTTAEAGLPGFHLHGLVRPVRAEGHTQADHRQTRCRTERGAEGRDREEPACRARRAASGAGTGDARCAGRASEIRDRQVDADHQGSGRCRRAVSETRE